MMAPLRVDAQVAIWGSWTIDFFLQPPADTFIWGQAGFVVGENLCILSLGSNA